MYPYRVFVSYSSNDTDRVEMVRQHLTALGAEPMELPPGMEFADEIKLRIAYAHLFIVLLTSASKESPWVHQEIGYALGQNIPVLPLALDELPKGMAEAIARPSSPAMGLPCWRACASSMSCSTTCSTTPS
ncbi:MAG: toll/interleukin-1 receptor domain-containing protein [Armatimonadota bacterium]